MPRKTSPFQNSQRLVLLEEVLKWLEEVLKWLEEVLKWLEEVLKWLEESLNLPPNFSPFSAYYLAF